MSSHDEEPRPITTRMGVSDGIVGNEGEQTLTGQGTEEDQEQASDFYEEIGAVIQGKSGEDVHGPDMEDEAS